MASSLLGQVASLPSIIAGPLALKTPNELYVGMIKSRTVYDKVIDRFDLRKVYKLKYQEDTRKKLEEAISAKSGKDGIIVITVEDKDPKRAADMANAFVDELKSGNPKSEV